MYRFDYMDCAYSIKAIKLAEHVIQGSKLPCDTHPEQKTPPPKGRRFNLSKVPERYSAGSSFLASSPVS